MQKALMTIQNLTSEIDGKPILKGLDLQIHAGEVHVIMGPNGAGKSTLANVLMGHPAYTVTGGSVEFSGEDLLAMKVHERARAGLFLSFQYPQEVPGVTVRNFIRTARKAVTGKVPGVAAFDRDLKTHTGSLQMDAGYLTRSLNVGFSGGEKKKNEILQMAMLRPKLAILDETDSGLDIDAIRVVYQTVSELTDEDNAVLIITHYNKILEYIRPDHVHVLVDGRIVRSGGLELAAEIEAQGYDDFRAGA